MAFRKQELDQLSGTVEEVVFANPDTGFAVVDLDAQGTLISAVGEMPGISQGEEVTLRGRFTQHPVYGEQFKVELCTRTLPSTSKGLEKYLAGGVIKGIGPKLARQLVEHFGDDHPAGDGSRAPAPSGDQGHFPAEAGRVFGAVPPGVRGAEFAAAPHSLRGGVGPGGEPV